MELICVDPKRIDEVWPHVKHLIRSAIEHTGLSDFDHIQDDVLDGDQFLWVAWNGEAIEAAATTELVGIGNKKICILTACAGEQRMRWMHLFDEIQKYAKDEGCSTMRIYGRKGWERVLPDFKAEHVILEKVL